MRTYPNWRIFTRKHSSFCQVEVRLGPNIRVRKSSGKREQDTAEIWAQLLVNHLQRTQLPVHHQGGGCLIQPNLL